METTGTQIEHCLGKDAETQNKILLVYSEETQIEPCLVEDTEMQNEDPYVLSQETQTDYPTVNVAIQTNTEESIPIYFFIIQEAVEAVVETEPMETQDNESHTKETPAYISLVREAFIRRL